MATPISKKKPTVQPSPKPGARNKSGRGKIVQEKPLEPAFTWAIRPYYIWNHQSLGSSGGGVAGLRAAIGSSLGKHSALFGIGLGAEHGISTPHLKELKGLKGERTGVSFTLESVERSPFSKDSPWSSVNRDARGLGFHSFCPAQGSDACWTALSVNSASSWVELHYQPTGSSWYGALSFDLSTKTYLHLADDQILRQYSHPARDIGFFGLSLEIGQTTAPKFSDQKKLQPASTIEIIQEIFKYILDDMGIAFSASASSDPLQDAGTLLDKAGYGNASGDAAPQRSATTEVPFLLLLNSVSGGMKQNAHLQFFDRLNDTQKSAFFWGNVINSVGLLAIAGAKDSGAYLQGGLSSLLYTGNLIPSYQKMSPEAAYWTRFALPHLVGLAGMLSDSAGTEQAFSVTAAEGTLANGFRASDAITTTRYSYTQLKTTQRYKSGESVENLRGEFALEHELPSGLAARYAIAMPQLSLMDGAVGTTAQNIGTDSGVISGNGTAYDGAPVSTTVSSAIGWRGTFGDTFYGSAAAFVGTSVDLGPTTPPNFGITGRASIAAGVGFTAFDTKLKLGVEASAGKTITGRISTDDWGVGIILSK